MADSSAIRAGSAFVEVFVKGGQVDKGLKEIGKKFQSWGAGIAAAGGVMTAGATGVLTAMGAAVGEFSKVGSDLTDMSSRTGVAAGALSELGYAAGLGGAEMGDLEAGIRKMQKGVGAGDAAFSKLGLNMEQLKGMSPEDQFLATADALSKINDPTQRAAMAMAVFGKSGTKLIPMLEGGAEGIQKLREQGRLMGNTLTNEDAAAADELGDKLGTLWGTVKGMALQIGAAIAPLVKFVVDGLQPIATAIVNVIKNNRGLIQGFAIGAAIVGAVGAALVAAGGAIFGIGTVIASVSGIVTAAAGVFTFLGTAIGVIFSPVGLVIAAVVALAAGIGFLAYKFFTATTIGKQMVTSLMAGFMQVWNLARATFEGIFNAISAGNLALAGKVAMAGLNVAWQMGLANLKNGWIQLTVFLVDTLAAALQKILSMFGGTFDAIIGKINAVLEFSGLKTIKLDSGSLQDKIKSAQAAVHAGADAKMKGNNADVDKAREHLDALLALAAAEKAASDAKSKLPNKKQFDDTGGQMDILKGSAAGTFSGFSAGLLSRAGGSALERLTERVAKATEGTEEKMDDVVAAVKDSVIRFA